MIVAKNFFFESAHKLNSYPGKCKELHGHSYKLTVKVSGSISKNGMVIDFVKLEKVVNKQVIDLLDHGYLNDFIETPTVENILLFIDRKIGKRLPVCELELWETNSSYAIFRRSDKDN